MSSEQENLIQAIALLEGRRAELGDEVVNAALAPLRQKLALLDKQQPPRDQAHGGERRIVTVLFCDVVGSTRLAERLDPEEWAEIMDRAFEGFIQSVERFEGTVARLMGDAILAFFGAPVAHEDDPERAVRAGLAILERTRVIGQSLLASRGLPLNVRVGINTGLVVVGDMGSDRYGEYTAMGDATNVAARMEQTAAPGTVQISEETYKFVAPLFEFKALGGIEVKGKNEPVIAYRVVGPRSRRGSLRGLETHGLSSPLIGRGEELNQVIESVGRLPTGQGGLLSVVGEAGLGKSRLVAEAANRFEPQIKAGQLRWLEGRSLNYGQNISYWPFQDILRRFAGIDDDTPAIVAWYRLERHIEELFGENTIEILPYLVTLLNLAVEGDYAQRVRHLDGETMGRMLFRAVRRFFQRLARSTPLVLAFEDVHWADKSSISLLEHLLPLVEKEPLLIMIVSRPQEDGLAGRVRRWAAENPRAPFAEIALTPLSRGESAQLVQNLLSVDVLPLPVRQTVVDKADGNPFFVEEIVRVMVDSGAVVRDRTSGQWRATTRVEGMAIPDTLQGVIMARIDALPEATREILRTASVIGRSFYHRVLQTVAGDDVVLDEHLERLLELDLIREKQRLPDLEYAFRHTMAQEVAYRSILRRTRRHLHARVGLAIESLFADQIEFFYGLLAYHFARAEEWQKAHVYLLKAGDRAGQISADSEALSHYGQAMEAYARAFGDKWDPVERGILERKIGEAFRRRGQHRQALQHMNEAIRVLDRRTLPASKWAKGLGIAQELVGQISFRLRPAFLSRRPAEASDERQAELLKVLVGLGNIYGYTDQALFIWVLLRTLNLAETNNFEHGMAMGYVGMGIAADIIPMLGLANRYHNLALDRATRIQHPEAIGYAYTGKAIHALHLARWPEALEDAQQAGSTFQETGNGHLWGLSTLCASLALISMGRLAEALSLGREICRLGEETADALMTAWGFLVQGIVLRHQAQFDEGADLLGRAADLARSVPDEAAVLWTSVEAARCLAGQGRPIQALEALKDSLLVAQQKGVRLNGGGLSAICLPSIAAIYLAAAEAAAEAGEAEQRATLLELAKESVKLTLKNTKAFRGSRPEALLLRGQYEWLQGQEARAQQSWRDSLREAEALDMDYAAAASMLEMGRRFSDRPSLERATALFEACGATYYSAQAQATLAALPAPSTSP